MMRIKLQFQVVSNDSTVECSAEIVGPFKTNQQIMQWCWETVKDLPWQFVPLWTLTVDGMPAAIPEYGLKFDQMLIASGWSVEDGTIDTHSFWLTKPFLGFTAEDLTLIERAWDNYEGHNVVLQNSSMPTSGVVLTREYPLDAITNELADYKRTFIL
jgi:hypothetical protein